MIRIRQLKINISKKQEHALLKKITKVLNIKEEMLVSFKIIKKSLDARKKDNLFYVYEVDVELHSEENVLKRIKSPDIFSSPKEEYVFQVSGTEELSTRPIIIGSGPAGLFCAYLLAQHGYNPLIIERGEKVEERVKSVEEFWTTGKLNINSNVQFGEGGAGTFSDGKLNTMVKDKLYRGKKVFEIFVENGAPEEIMYLNNPHIGTDLLRDVIKNIRNKIISMGGEFKYNTTLTNIILEKDSLIAVEVNNQEIIPCPTLVLAIGHSARDTFEMLYNKGLKMFPKPFAVGVRIEHSQQTINEAQYGLKSAHMLPAASYKLTYTTKDKRGVYSFCMCPGGYVVNASSEEGYLAVNGMSNHARNTKNANSALVVTISPKDYGEHPLDGLKFQRHLEKLAYTKGQGNIPLQLYKDFKENKLTTKLGKINPSLKGNYTFANLNEVLPEYISTSLKEAIPFFNTKIKGFEADDAILLGIESRTSSPIKMERDETGLSNIEGVYPCGEGAGYAGGITSAAMDGIRLAENIAKKYKPLKDRN